MLELDSRNVKALYRRAQAYIHLVDLDLAEIDIKKALEIEPDNRYALGLMYDLLLYIQFLVCINLCWMGVCRDVKIEYKILKEKVREYNKKDAQFYGNIFAKMNKLEQTRNVAAKQEPVPMTVDSKA